MSTLLILSPALCRIVDVCRGCHDVIERELSLVATKVAVSHHGRHRGDRRLYERCGPNVKTMSKYLHVARIWIHFCLVAGMFFDRWKYAALDGDTWCRVALHMHTYGGRCRGLSDTSLESYMRMLSNILVCMACTAANRRQFLIGEQHRLIQRVVDEHCGLHPYCRSLRNTKSAWDDGLVDAAMQLLLQWHVYGHCNMHFRAWPAFARMVLAVLNHTGWRPFQVTRDRLDAADARWTNHPILSFGLCSLVWRGGVLVAVGLTCLRTKFRRNPRQELNADGQLVDRPLLAGKLTCGAAVDTCPVSAFLVWAVVCGVFGWAPLVRDGSRQFVVSSNPARIPVAQVTSDMVDALVASIFALQPSRALPDFCNTALFDGTLLSSSGQQVHTDRCSNTVHVVGVRLGLDPRRCSGISARKTMATAIVCHPQTTAFDTHRFLGHADPRTTHVHYADPRAANNDSSAILRRQQVSCVLVFHVACLLLAHHITSNFMLHAD